MKNYLQKLFAPLKSVVKNCTPNPTEFAAYCDLYSRVLRLFPNGKMPPRFTSMAIMGCHRTKAVIFGENKKVSVICDDLSGLLRQGASKLRELAGDGDKVRLLMVKAGIFVFLVRTHTHSSMYKLHHGSHPPTHPPTVPPSRHEHESMNLHMPIPFYSCQNA